MLKAYGGIYSKSVFFHFSLHISTSEKKSGKHIFMKTYEHGKSLLIKSMDIRFTWSW